MTPDRLINARGQTKLSALQTWRTGESTQKAERLARSPWYRCFVVLRLDGPSIGAGMLGNQ